MKKLAITVTLALALTGFVSCREYSNDVEHHSESKSAEDNPVDNPSTTSSADSTTTGMDNRVPAQSSDTINN
jgi:hypothetical protein